MQIQNGHCDGCVKYEEAEVDRLVAILKTNNCDGIGGGGCGGGQCGIRQNSSMIPFAKIDL